MKPLTEAQVHAFQAAITPPHRIRNYSETAIKPETSQAAKNRVATRRAIEEHKERLALQREWEF